MLVICFSHIRWKFVFQRPQHLMSAISARNPVLFWEEPQFDAIEPWLELRRETGAVTVAVPHLASGLTPAESDAALRFLLDEQIGEPGEPLTCWYYTPMMLTFSRHLQPRCVVYDCMDELANFRFAPDLLPFLETELFARADLVFTGGYSLYEAKRSRHDNVHAFPSGVDVAHFAQARTLRSPSRGSTRPTLGFYGVIDERMNLDIVAALADARPDWSVVMVGPVVKIDEADLPRRPNISYLGGKDYSELPGIVAHWDVALMPFAINAATQFISPTKTPEYLAAGLPVVSTPITDVVRQYEGLDAVEIAASSALFIAACGRAIARSHEPPEAVWRVSADEMLASQSWQLVVSAMMRLVEGVLLRKRHTGKHYDYLVVGAGYAGSVMAERLAAGSGLKVLVIDRRDHIAGNAFDHLDDAGILVHRYGPHIFHTNSEKIVEYLSRFTDWRPYEHRVLAEVDGQRVPIPINRDTLNRLYNLELSSDEDTADFLSSRAEAVSPVVTSEDVVISRVGTELYEKFFRGYTRKQWGMDPSELDKSVAGRVPTRTNTDDRYFNDSFQAMPARGYTAMFAAMLDHPQIEIELGVSFEDVRSAVGFDKLIFTGPIDEYFDHCYGKLPYRSLSFQHETLDVEWAQTTAVVNFPAEAVPHTRVTEYKHITGQVSERTSVTYEIPCAEGDPYYPVPRPENEALFKRYEALSMGCPDVTFVGRLATYRYYNMDQVVGQALAAYRRIVTQYASEQTSVAAK